MRYFKYKNIKENEKNAEKEQYKALTKDEKRIFKKQKAWKNFSTVASWASFLLFACVGAYVISLLHSSDWLLRSALFVVKFILYLIWIICSGVLTYGLTMPLWKKVESFNLPSKKKQIFYEASRHLRNYYGFQEPYIITKCFDSTDKKFKNHDVCIFISNDELRITADLKHGFLYGERDLGCYALSRGEISISKRGDENHFFAELKGENISFSLGYKAKGFIEKNYILQNC